MGKSKYVIFLDVDGTLVDSSYVPTDRVVEAIKKAQSAGHKIFINTARQKRTVPEAINKKFPRMAMCVPQDNMWRWRGKL